MSLIKAIAAQIAASDEPLRMQLHLICTFRTRSELHAYGSFLHQITRDPRFTSWLHVEIYVSRPDKPQTLLGAHAHVVKNDIQVPSKTAKKEKKKRFMSLKRTGTFLKRALSGRTIVGSDNNEKTSADDLSITINTKEHHESSSESSLRKSNSVHTIVSLGDIVEENETKKVFASDSEKISEIARASPTSGMTYHNLPLPTFQAANSASVASKWAKFDLFLTCFIILVPLAGWCAARTVPWEGPSNWCPANKLKGTYYSANCRWTYAMIPGAIQFFSAGFIGYLGLILARIVFARRGRDVEKGLPYPDFETEDERLATEDGNWDEGDVVYSRGRLDVKKAIQNFVDSGVGSKEKGNGLVSVFGGGPDGFVDMVEKYSKQANWSVDFHRETWAP
ncbi:hypothetical protein BGZ76_000605 [Entomortierella beljakovae]|nr:hypothetical protein BGZ76_000605 [Entomortierella beljakovae]